MVRRPIAKRFFASIATLGLLTTCCVAPVDGAPITFDLTGDAELAAGVPLTVTTDGVDLTATGWTTGEFITANAPFASPSPRGLSQTVNGLGVFAGIDTLDVSQTDGFGAAESLRFQFSEPVRLTKVTFSLATVDDEFDFGIGPNLDPAGVADVQVNFTFGSDSITTVGTPLGPGTLPIADFDVAIGPTVFIGGEEVEPDGQTFEFYLTDFNDDYKIVSLTAEPVIDLGPDDIPEPATLLLGLLAVLGGGTSRRRR